MKQKKTYYLPGFSRYEIDEKNCVIKLGGEINGRICKPVKLTMRKNMGYDIFRLIPDSKPKSQGKYIRIDFIRLHKVEK